MWYNFKKLQGKFLLSAIAIVVLTITIIVMMGYAQNRIFTTFNQLFADSTPRLLLSQEIQSEVDSIRTLAIKFINTPGTAEQEGTPLATIKFQLLAHIDDLRRLSKNYIQINSAQSKRRADFSEFNSLENKIVLDTLTLLELKSTKPADLKTMLLKYTVLSRDMVRFNKLVFRASDQFRQQFQSQLEESSKFYKKSLVVSTVIGIVVVLLIILIVYLLSKMVVKPIVVLSRYSKQVAQAGNFQAPLMDYHSKDEVGDLYSNIKKMTKYLIKTTRSANDASKAKSMFLSSVSHEIRTPLNAIIGFSELIDSEGPVTGEQKECLLNINTSANHLLTLIGDVLDLSKIESKKLELSIEPVNFSLVLEECKKALSVLAKRFVIAQSMQSERKGPFVFSQQSRHFRRPIPSAQLIE